MIAVLDRHERAPALPAEAARGVQPPPAAPQAAPQPPQQQLQPLPAAPQQQVDAALAARRAEVARGMLQQALQELSAADRSNASAMRNPLRRLAKLGHGR